jgi:hypothetical protein
MIECKLTFDDVADVYIPAPNRPKLVRWPALASWKELYRKMALEYQEKLVVRSSGTCIILHKLQSLSLHNALSEEVSPRRHRRMVP